MLYCCIDLYGEYLYQYLVLVCFRVKFEELYWL